MELFDLEEWFNGTDASACEHFVYGLEEAVEFMRFRGELISNILDYLCDNFGGDYEDIVREYIDGESEIYTR